MVEGTLSILELEEQKEKISDISKRILINQERWCLIDNKWYKQWKKYVGYDDCETTDVRDRAGHPGPIDNSSLLRDDGSGEIEDHLIHELDYVLLPEKAWNFLVKWYGFVEGQQPIVRKVVEYGSFVKHCKVEVYLLEFKLCTNWDEEHVVTKKFSKSDTIGYIEQEMRTIFNILPEKETMLWNRYCPFRYENLSNKHRTVHDAGLYHGQVLIILESNDDGSWPNQVKRLQDQSLSVKAADPPQQVQCVVCLKPKEIVTFEPCEHKVCCEDCCMLIEKCLICDAVIAKNTTKSVQILSTVIRQGLQRERYLENKLQEMEEANRCSICLEAFRNVAFMCGHGACLTCAQKINTCHMCRETITQKIHLY